MTEELLQALPAIWIATGAIGASIYDDNSTCKNGDCPSLPEKYLKESVLVLGGPVTLISAGISIGFPAGRKLFARYRKKHPKKVDTN